MGTYSEKLKDPRWQKKRLEIFKRDNWRCIFCGDKGTTLNIHHLFYFKDKEPWEVSDGFLITLCEYCHGLTFGKELGEDEEPLDIVNDVGTLLSGIWMAGYGIEDLLTIGSAFYSSKHIKDKIVTKIEILPTLKAVG